MTKLSHDQILKLLSDVVPNVAWEGISMDTSLEESGLDSLDKATFFMNLESESGVSIPDEVYEGMDTIEGIFAFVNA